MLKKPAQTLAVELVGDEPPLFALHVNNKIGATSMNLGEFQYGCLPKSAQINREAMKNEPTPLLFDLWCVEVDEEFQWDSEPNIVQFYTGYGAPGASEAMILRPFRFPREMGYIRLKDLFGDTTRLEYNDRFRRWALSKFSKLTSVARTLSDVSMLKLLTHGYATFHSGAIEVDGKAFLITGLPDTGKSYSTLQLVSEGHKFVSEDEILIGPKLEAIGLPFTQSMERGKGLGLYRNMKRAVVQSLYKMNYGKDTFFDTPLYDGKNVCSRAPIGGVFFLRRGEPCVVEANSESIVRNIVNLNRLEFTFWQNPLITTYIFLDGSCTINDILDKEVKLFERLVQSVPVFEVHAPDHTGFKRVIEKCIAKL